MTGRHTYQHPLACGFTLFEFMITVALAAVLTITGIPALSAFVQNQRISAEINLIIAHLHLARTVAISKSASVVMCKSDSQADCVVQAPLGSDWSGGWILFIDTNDNGARDAAEPLLRIRPALNGNLRIWFNQTGRIRYRPTGQARSGRFTVCDRRGPQFARSVILYWTGRPRTVRESGGRFARACASLLPAT